MFLFYCNWRVRELREHHEIYQPQATDIDLNAHSANIISNVIIEVREIVADI